MYFTRPVKHSSKHLLRSLLFIGISIFLSIAPLRTANAWYVGVDGFYGAVGVDTLIDDIVILVDAGDNLQHGGGARFNIGFGRKWVTEFSVGFYQGRIFKIVDPVTDQDILQGFLSNFIQGEDITLTVTAALGGVRRQAPQSYATLSLEGRYYVLGDFAYDPDVPNDIFFGLGGDWVIPSFWEGSDYLSVVPSLKVVGGYTRRLTRSLFMEIGAEIFVVPTPPANVFNMRLGLKYAF